MKRKLLSISYGFALAVLITTQSKAQAKDDTIPALKVLPRLSNQKSPSKLSAPLKQLYENYMSASAPSLNAKATLPDIQQQKYMFIKGDQVSVDITVKEYNTATRNHLEKLGLKITGAYGRVVSGMIPVSSISAFESSTMIKFVRPSLRKKNGFIYRDMRGGKNLQYFAASGPVISQGDTALRSYLARKNFNVTGKGVKIGILSDSYNNLGTAHIGVKNGELPGLTNPYNHKKPVKVLMDLDDSSGIDEGRAMAEIIHDIAPDAEILFYTAYISEASFAEGIVKLAEAGCKVIVDDIAYFDEPFFQDGIVAQAVDQVKKMGVAYFSAAGNSGSSSYEGAYKQGTYQPFGAGNGFAHNFSGPGAAPLYFLPVTIPIGGYFALDFQWDQPFFSAGGLGSASDLDFYLVNSSATTILARSENFNLETGDPEESMVYYNNTRTTSFLLFINKFEGPNPGQLKILSFGDEGFPALVPAIPGSTSATIVGHSNAAGAIATGAANYLYTPAYGVDSPRAETFSSIGGVPIIFDAKGNRVSPTFRRKPEFVSIDGGNTSFFYADSRQDSDTFPNFFGTSAAAPHAAAVAALMIEAQKQNTITPDMIRGVMAANSIDMDNRYFAGFEKGFDFATGTGLLKADAAVGVVKFPNTFIKDLKLEPVCSDNPAYTREWVVINPNPFEVEVHWLINALSQQGVLMAASGETKFTSQTRPLANIAIIDWNDNLGIPHFAYSGSTSAQCGKASVSAANTDKLSEMATNAETLDNASAVSVYPNPVSKNFRVTLSFNNEEKTELNLYSLEGKLLLKKTTGSSGTFDIDASRYAPGMYILKVKQKNFDKAFKLIKK